MKINLIILLLLCTGCAPAVKLKDEYKEGTINASQIPDINEIVDIKDGVKVMEERIGDKYVITSLEDEPVTVSVKLEYDPIKIDACTMEVDLSEFFSNPEKQAKATYEIGEDVVKVTYEDSEFEVPYVIVYPRYEVVEEPVIDVYTWYEIEDIVKAPDMEIEHSLDEENSKLNVKLSKGLWSEELSIDVTLVDSNPFPMIYTCQDDEWKDNIFDITIYEDGSMYYPKHNLWGGWNKENHTWYWDGYPIFSYFGEIGDENFSLRLDRRMNGNYQFKHCTLKQTKAN